MFIKVVWFNLLAITVLNNLFKLRNNHLLKIKIVEVILLVNNFAWRRQVIFLKLPKQMHHERVQKKEQFGLVLLID